MHLVGLLTACEQDQDVPSWSCFSLYPSDSVLTQAISKPVWHIPLLCVQWKTIDDGQRNCPKHVEFYSKNKFVKLVHLIGLLTACEQDQDVPSWSCFSLYPSDLVLTQAISKPVWHVPLLCVKWKTPDDGQRNSPKHVVFYSKNKFEKLVHLVGFIIRSHDSDFSVLCIVTSLLKCLNIAAMNPEFCLD